MNEVELVRNEVELWKRIASMQDFIINKMAEVAFYVKKSVQLDSSLKLAACSLENLQMQMNKRQDMAAHADQLGKEIEALKSASLAAGQG